MNKKKYMIGFGIDLFPEVNILSIFEEIDGIEGENLINENFDEDENISKYRIKLINGNDIGKFKTGLKIINKIDSEGFFIQNNGYIYLIDKTEKVVQSYFISDFEIVTFEIADEDKFNVIIDGFLQIAPRGTKKVWHIRLNKKKLVYNFWKKLEHYEKQAWLEVAFNFQTEILDKKGLIIALDGNLITDEDSFFCCLGEAINGPGGYFGRDLISLQDCLNGGYGIELPLTIIWENHLLTKDKLTKAFFDKIISVFEINNVKLVFE